MDEGDPEDKPFDYKSRVFTNFVCDCLSEEEAKAYWKFLKKAGVESSTWPLNYSKIYAEDDGTWTIEFQIRNTDYDHEG